MRTTACIFLLLVTAVAILPPDEVIAAETAGVGDIEFFLDGAVFREAQGKAIQEIYIRIPNSELRFRETDGKWESLIRFSVTVTGPGGEKIVEDSEEMRFYETLEADALSSRQFHTIVKQFRLDEGEYDLSCEILDVYAPKVSLMGMVRKRHRMSRVDYYPLDIPGFQGKTMAVSGAKFLWEIERNGPDMIFHPNPSRMYGLYRDSVRVYIEAYVPSDFAETGTVDFGVEILDADGEVVKEATLPLPRLSSSPGDPVVTYPIVIQEDINTLAAGSYTLYVNAGFPEELLVRMRCGAFNVAWDLRTWEVSRRDYMAEARFLIGDNKKVFEDFEKKSPGEQERIIEAMWKELDPDPNTGFNEAYDKFLTRLAYVRQRYTDYHTGVFTDRGLIYLRYGQPDDKEVDVVPKNRESLAEAMQKVDDKYQPVSFSSSGGNPLRYARPGQNIDVDPRRLSVIGEQGNVGYPYELWIYESGGDPIRERDKAMEQDIGMRFIFVDTDGYGRYKLESSSIMIGK
ncbi:MAG: GWxTD domain-containing protein [Candidatus Latescibacterota bacterium]|nr:MAG: GWxTD domain-containing protein [Candidatus Latescibacterota bacterium]